MVIVDSSIWIDFFNARATPHTTWLDSAKAAGNVGITTLVLAEVLQGIRFETSFRAAEQHLRTMPIFENVGTSLAVQSARNFRALRRIGITVRSTIDCLIATFCIVEGHELLHCDNDYQGFESFLGLQVVHP